ncbi:MAG: type II toxin-antitoxin system RatA family toxin [Legionellaceae bacterium]|nr:type II toxin-antitoxin system RatA family toxin [Legionellaceae bacterium]
MTVVKKSRVVSYSCQQMYDLVNDIDSYADFVPYFSSSVVHHRDEDEVQATLSITAAGISKSFTTRNRLQPNKMIEMRLVDGPFSHLEGFWRFDEVLEGCLISFDLEFEFAGRMFSMLLGPVFEQVTDKMVDAFCDRASGIYDTLLKT